jgi:EmrB/QacA subfamily drug resistance transporter
MNAAKAPGTVADRTAPTETRTDSGAGARAGPNKWAVWIVIAIGIFMATLDSSIVNIGLPAIARHFGTALGGTIEWVVIAYLVVMAAAMLTIGRLADIVGRKPVWATGLIVFTIASALCGAASSLGFLVGFRALQGFGAAMLMAISPAMLLAAFPANERGRALGMNALVASIGVSTGPTIGGILTQTLGWRAIFYVNVPVGILGFILAMRILKEERRPWQGRFDPAGAILLAIGLASLTLGLSFGAEWGWGSPRIVAALVIGTVGLLAMIVVELRVREPVLDLTLFRNRVFASASFSQILSFLALAAVGFLLPFYLEQLRGYSTTRAGLLLTPLPITIAIVAPFSGSLADRVGTRILAPLGLGIACVGLFLLSQLRAGSPIWLLLIILPIVGLGQGLFQSPNNSAMLGAVPPGRTGVASGILATGRTVGQSVSVALAGAIFTSAGAAVAGAELGRIHHGEASQPAGGIAALQHTFEHGFHAAFVVCAGLAALGILTSLVRGDAHKGNG